MRQKMLIAVAVGGFAISAFAQSEPTVKSDYDQFDNRTVVSLRLQNTSPANPRIALRSNDSFPGRVPTAFPQEVSLFIEGFPYSGGSNVVLLDGQRIELGQIEDGRLKIPVWLAAGIASAGHTVQARLAGQAVLAFEAEHREAMRDFLSRIVPGGGYDRGDLDSPRAGNWSADSTVDYINRLLKEYRWSDLDYHHVELDGSRVAVYNFSERSPNTVGGYGDNDRWQALLDHLSPLQADVSMNAILLDCRRKQRCVSFYILNDDHSNFRFFESQPDLQLKMRADAREMEKVKNAFSYLVQVGSAGR